MTTEITIRNTPAWARNYEFIIARLCDGEFWFYDVYAEGWRAEAVAKEVGGVIFHNVRIQGHKEA